MCEQDRENQKDRGPECFHQERPGFLPLFVLTLEAEGHPGPEIGRRRSSAQLTQRYTAADLLGRQVLAVVNFPPRQIATFLSEVLVLGLPDAHGNVVLVQPQSEVPLGGRLL